MAGGEAEDNASQDWRYFDSINMQGSGPSWNKGLGIGPPRVYGNRPMVAQGNHQRPASDRSRRPTSPLEGLESQTLVVLQTTHDAR